MLATARPSGYIRATCASGKYYTGYDRDKNSGQFGARGRDHFALRGLTDTNEVRDVDRREDTL